jgi:hypothetical protein
MNRYMRPAIRKSPAPRAKAATGAAVERKPAAFGAKRGAGNAVARFRADPAVETFLRELKHPLKSEVLAVRSIILGVSPTIREAIKWNSPSFFTSEFFATLNLRAKDGEQRVWLILHTGAKPRPGAKRNLQIADPTGMLEWLAKDRCLLTFADKREVQAGRAALENIVRHWIRWI